MARAEGGLKRCSHCKDTLAVDAFGKNRNKPDGLNDCCLACRRGIDANKRLGRGYGPMSDPRRFPIDPLLVAMGAQETAGPGVGQAFVRPVHEILGVERSSITMWRKRGGMRWPTADRVACAAGFHPSDIWTEWYDAPDTPNGDAA